MQILKDSVLKNALILLSLGSAVFGNTKAADPAFKKVNKAISLGEYTPTDLVTYNGVMLSKRIVHDLDRLLAAAKKDGLTLKVVSGYRSYIYQKEVFARWSKKEQSKNTKLSCAEAEKRANAYSARPGHSEHQLGTVVDILSSENNFSFTITPSLKYVTWLEKNASKYNFTISYPKGGTEYVYEPWHLRWYPPSSQPA
jgi:D-alanyl-D-alanine carboxypeptidase